MKMFAVILLVLLLNACSLNADPARDERAMTGCAAIRLVSRRQWGPNSAPTDTGISLKAPVDYIFIHHTDGPACRDLRSCSSTVKAIYNSRKFTNSWGDIGYNFLIGEDGRVYEGVGWEKVGAHTYGWNSRSVAISFIGNYTSKLAAATMHTAAKNLILCGISLKKISSGYGLYGHRDGTCTECPGNALYNALKTWTNWHKLGNVQQFCGTSSVDNGFKLFQLYLLKIIKNFDEA